MILYLDYFDCYPCNMYLNDYHNKLYPLMALTVNSTPIQPTATEINIIYNSELISLTSYNLSQSMNSGSTLEIDAMINISYTPNPIIIGLFSRIPTWKGALY